MDIRRHQRGLNVSGKQIPNVGGGWNTSRYNINDFIKRSKCVGIVFESQKAGHNKAYISQHNVTDSLTVSLHNPTPTAAKDIVKYSAKYNIIKLGYYFSDKQFVQGKDFSYHEEELFQKNDDLNFEKLKNKDFYIDRNFVMKFVKQSFQNIQKIDFNNLVLKTKELNS